jgi:hypothetical protein
VDGTADDGTDNVRYLYGPEPSTGRHQGSDPSGTVRVEIDDDARHARVSFAAGWRDGVGVPGLGPAVEQAVGAAAAARLRARAAAPSASPPDPQLDRPSGSPAEVVDDAWRDLREFQVRLAQLNDLVITVSGPDDRVRVTIRGGRLVAVDPDLRWASTASDAELTDHLQKALRAALATVAALPERALDGCPGLRARLVGPP